ncbi:ABC transporter ATP-binding protein, partial [Escherichia coli]|nr:ABC transporter ATP-binding protein [Escherichia coli]
RGYEKPLIIMSLLATIVAVVEVMLFGAMGQLVDWMSTSNPETFLQDNKSDLIFYGSLLLVVMPILVILYSLLVHQTLLGNY